MTSAKTNRAVTILDAMADGHLFAGSFPQPDSWAAWRAFR